MNISLAGKTALVTGASRGIGRAIAIALAEAGASIIFTYNNSPKDAEVTATAIAVHGQNALAKKLDISDETAIIRFSGNLMKVKPLLIFWLITLASLWKKQRWSHPLLISII